MLNPATLHFLQQLSTNNNREWFHANKAAYKSAKADFEAFVTALIDVLSASDADMHELQASACVFRIHRDVRFSKNKAPYKPNFGASITKGGRKSLIPGYYIHLQPNGQSFIGGGLYHPPAPLLKAVRQEIDYNTEAFDALVHAADFTATYSKLQGEQLQRAPKGYDPAHPAIKWLKHKDFIAMKQLPDTMWTSADAVEKVAADLRVLQPLKSFLAMPLADDEVLEALRRYQR